LLPNVFLGLLVISLALREGGGVRITAFQIILWALGRGLVSIKSLNKQTNKSRTLGNVINNEHSKNIKIKIFHEKYIIFA
jgi:hypothetical protein